MTNTFEFPTFGKRVRSMLKLDFYRLFHTPAFYIFLVIAAIIPAMVLSLAGVDMSPPQSGSQYAADVPQMEMPDFENAWQMVESGGGITAISGAEDDPVDFAQFMSINMLFIFAGLLMSIFVAHDYSSGFVKNIFTVHSKRLDYVISKSAIGIFSGAGMVVTYVLGTVLAGLLTGKSFELASISGLIFCLMSKAFLMGVFCSLFLGVAVFFRNKLWLTIVFTFLFGMMLYPAATNIADLNSSIVTMILALVAGVVGAVGFGAVSLRFLNKRDLA